MATTLKNLRDSLRIEVRDPDGIQFTDAQLDYNINQAYRKSFYRIISVNEDYFITSASLNIVAGTETVALPSDHLRTKEIFYLPSSDLRIPMHRYRGGISEQSETSAVLGTSSYLYDYEGNNLLLKPIPGVSVTSGLLIKYYQDYVKMVADASTINNNFKDGWADVIVLEAARACTTQIEIQGALVSNDLDVRLKEIWKVILDLVSTRTLSPVYMRGRGYIR